MAEYNKTGQKVTFVCNALREGAANAAGGRPSQGLSGGRRSGRKDETDFPDVLVEAQDELDFYQSVLYCTYNPYIIKIGEVSLEMFFDIVYDRLAPLKISDAATYHRNL
ncbi:MAG: hypothetical protein LBD55_12110 [Treponema sp.]|nr:hypothetical protein [Treponema sp.]